MQAVVGDTITKKLLLLLSRLHEIWAQILEDSTAVVEGNTSGHAPPNISSPNSKWGWGHSKSQLCRLCLCTNIPLASHGSKTIGKIMLLLPERRQILANREVHGITHRPAQWHRVFRNHSPSQAAGSDALVGVQVKRAVTRGTLAEGHSWHYCFFKFRSFGLFMYLFLSIE